MEPSAFSTNRAFREWRRFQIWELHQQGWKQHAIATALGITQGAVSQTLTRVKTRGTDALKTRPLPGVPSKLTRDHLSVISAVSPEGELFLQMQEDAFDSDGIIGFLDALQTQIEGNFVIVWDGATIHRSIKLKEYLANGAAKRIHLERLPGYAPELNPDEGIWHYLKHVEMKNLCCADMTELTEQLHAATKRLQDKPEIIQACFRQVGYY